MGFGFLMVELGNNFLEKICGDGRLIEVYVELNEGFSWFFLGFYNKGVGLVIT